ncbi:MAG: hypothetical protein GY835_23935 [bacterium]|nr:hypothetical protein [bacterium]
MTIGSFSEYEVRYLDKSTTRTASFTAADQSAWDNATKIRVQELNTSGLTDESVKDPSTQTNPYGREANIRTVRGGSFSFRMWLEGGASDQTAPAVATLLGGVMGGLFTPTKMSDAAEGSCTTTDIKLTGHASYNGQHALFGALADSGGDGRVGIIEDADTSADAYDLELALPGSPSTSDVVKYGHVAYFDPTLPQRYFDFIVIGGYAGTGATDDPDQFNMIGCSGTFTLGGLGEGEAPYVEFTFQPANWRGENYADQASFQHTVAASGDDPVGDQHQGSLTLQDTGTTTRATVQGGNVEINPNMALVPIRDPNSSNAIGGWKKQRSADGPTISITRYWGDMPGLVTDWQSGTDKACLYQLGNTSGGTVSIYFQRARLMSYPSRAELDGNVAQQLVLEGAAGNATSLASEQDYMEDSPMTIAFL